MYIVHTHVTGQKRASTVFLFEGATLSKLAVFVGKTAYLHTTYLDYFDGYNNASAQPARWGNCFG